VKVFSGNSQGKSLKPKNILGGGGKNLPSPLFFYFEREEKNFEILNPKIVTIPGILLSIRNQGIESNP
jgi:hypothetical protein